MPADTTTPALASPEYHREISTAPLFGQILVNSGTTASPAGLRTFNFAANGSDERAGLLAVLTYIQDEAAAGRWVHCLAGVGDYGIQGNGFATTLPAGAEKISFLGSGRNTRFGFVNGTSAGPNFTVLQFLPDIPYLLIPTGVSVLGDTVTVTVVLGAGHNAVVGSYVRTERIGSEGTEGLHKVTAITATDVTFVTDIPVTVGLGLDPGVLVLNSYIKDFELGNFSMLDTDPVNTQSGGEESHGISLKGHLGLHLHDILSKDIGDESFDLIACEQFYAHNFHSIGTPSVQTAGGAFFSVKNGCHEGVVDGVFSRDPWGVGSLTYVFNLKTSGTRMDISDLSINNILAINPELTTIRIGSEAANISRCTFRDITAVGGLNAITQGGASFNQTDIDIYDLKATKQTDLVVSYARNLTNTKGFTLHNPVLDGTHLTSVNKELIRISGTNCTINNPTLRNAIVGILAVTTDNLVVRGGTADNLGTGATGADSTPFRSNSGDGMVIDGMAITNCGGDRAIFNNVDTVINCPQIHSAGSLTQGISNTVKHFSGNHQVSHSVRTSTTATGGSIQDNSFLATAPGSLGMIGLRSSGFIVTGNRAPNQVANAGIIEEAGQDRNIIKDNNMEGAAITKVGANTIAVDNL